MLDAFGDLERRGLLREGISPAYAAYATLSLMDGLQIQWLLDRTVLDMAEVLRVYLETLTGIDLRGPSEASADDSRY
jgi:hypothetical protein